MEINDLIKEYRKLTGITQSILIDQIKKDSGINVSLGTLNGIEHTGSIADYNLETYLYSRFYINDIKSDKEIIDCTYKIASYCVLNNINIDIEELFSFTRKEELAYYLKRLDDNILEYLYCSSSLSDIIEVSECGNKEKTICFNQGAKCIYYIVYWYILLSHKEIEIFKTENISTEELNQIAEVFGYKEYATTSGQARGKINKAINKRLSLIHHISSFDAIIKSNNFYTYAIKNESNNFIKKILDNDIEDLTLNELKECIDISSKFEVILQNCYAFYQGIFFSENLDYVNNFISYKFRHISDSEEYKSLKPIINSLTHDYNEYYELYNKTRDESISILLYRIKRTLFNIYKSLESIEFNVFRIESYKENISRKYKSI